MLFIGQLSNQYYFWQFKFWWCFPWYLFSETVQFIPLFFWFNIVFIYFTIYLPFSNNTSHNSNTTFYLVRFPPTFVFPICFSMASVRVLHYFAYIQPIYIKKILFVGKWWKMWLLSLNRRTYKCMFHIINTWCSKFATKYWFSQNCFYPILYKIKYMISTKIIIYIHYTIYVLYYL